MSDLPCTEDVPTCGDTCELLLACGHHNCTRRCHSGQCEVCRQMIHKICRCGKRQKSVQCSQEFICDIKCPKLKNCQRHQCRRKVSESSKRGISIGHSSLPHLAILDIRCSELEVASMITQTGRVQ